MVVPMDAITENTVMNDRRLTNHKGMISINALPHAGYQRPGLMRVTLEPSSPKPAMKPFLPKQNGVNVLSQRRETAPRRFPTFH